MEVVKDVALGFQNEYQGCIGQDVSFQVPLKQNPGKVVLIA